MVKITSDYCKEQFGQALISVWLHTPKGDVYVKPRDKGVWIVSEVPTHHLCLERMTLQMKGGEITNLPKLKPQ